MLQQAVYPKKRGSDRKHFVSLYVAATRHEKMSAIERNLNDDNVSSSGRIASFHQAIEKASILRVENPHVRRMKKVAKIICSVLFPFVLVGAMIHSGVKYNNARFWRTASEQRRELVATSDRRVQLTCAAA